MKDEKHVFSSGASSTAEKPRYDLIPLAALRRLANRFGYGAAKHGDHNYKNGAQDPEFVRDRKNHLIEHASKYATGDRSIDHLGAIMCNAAMLAEIEHLTGEPVPPQSVERPQAPPTAFEVAPQTLIHGEWQWPGRSPLDPIEHDHEPCTAEQCGLQQAGTVRGTCGRPKGHDGDHVAFLSDSNVCGRWQPELQAVS